MRSRRWRSIQSGLPESAHGSPELVKHASLVEVDGMSRNTGFESGVAEFRELETEAARTAGLPGRTRMTWDPSPDPLL